MRILRSVHVRTRFTRTVAWRTTNAGAQYSSHANGALRAFRYPPANRYQRFKHTRTDDDRPLFLL
jgi:hypothetical protein